MAKTTFIATGDSFMTRRLPEGGYPGFEQVQELINSHDARFNNLEFTAHDKEGYPAAVSGGTWAMAEPEVLDDLNAFGFNLYNTANNHSMDYTHGGLLATIRHLRERGMRFAGTGANLHDASAPVYLDTPNARVALIGACTTANQYASAGNQSISLPGRPGLNPLRCRRIYHVRQAEYDSLKVIAQQTCINARADMSIRNGYSLPSPEGTLIFGGHCFVLSDKAYQHSEPNQKDMDRILAHIKEAKRQADYVLVSIHSHEFDGESIVEPALYMQTFAKAAIDAGADAILGHGPHELQGIEIYRGKPIFYSLGNFIFQTETVSLQPADAYENKGMPYDTLVGEFMDRRSKNRTCGYIVQPNIWRSVMAGFTAEDGKITQIQLYPIDLGMDMPRSRMGFPKIANNDDVLKYLAELSKPFGTTIEVKDNIATIQLA